MQVAIHDVKAHAQSSVQVQITTSLLAIKEQTKLQQETQQRGGPFKYCYFFFEVAVPREYDWS